MATVLLVEDDECVRTLLRHILEHARHQVITTASADEALQQCARLRGTIDLLLTDVVLPGFSGCELALQVQATYPQIKILYISGYPVDLLGERGCHLGQADFLAKPFTPVALLAKIAVVLSPADCTVSR